MNIRSLTKPLTTISMKKLLAAGKTTIAEIAYIGSWDLIHEYGLSPEEVIYLEGQASKENEEWNGATLDELKSRIPAKIVLGEKDYNILVRNMQFLLNLDDFEPRDECPVLSKQDWQDLFIVYNKITGKRNKFQTKNETAPSLAVF
jgi:hypothetical protein